MTHAQCWSPLLEFQDGVSWTSYRLEEVARKQPIAPLGKSRLTSKHCLSMLVALQERDYQVFSVMTKSLQHSCSQRLPASGLPVHPPPVHNHRCTSWPFAPRWYCRAVQWAGQHALPSKHDPAFTDSVSNRCLSSIVWVSTLRGVITSMNESLQSIDAACD